MSAGTLNHCIDIGGILVGQFRIGVAEALVMLGRHRHVFHPCWLVQPGLFPGNTRPEIELRCQLLVLDNQDGFFLHRPFLPRMLAEKARVDEHPESFCTPPSRPADLILRRRPRHRIASARDSRNRQRWPYLRQSVRSHREQRHTRAQQHMPTTQAIWSCYSDTA